MYFCLMHEHVLAVKMASVDDTALNHHSRTVLYFVQEECPLIAGADAEGVNWVASHPLCPFENIFYSHVL